MIRIVFISIMLLNCLLFACSNQKAHRKDTSKIVSKAGHSEYTLLEKLEMEMKSQFSAYELPSRANFSKDVMLVLGSNNLPYLIKGDFNGDNLADIALLLKEKNNNKLILVAFHQTRENGYISHIITKDATVENSDLPTPLYDVYIQLLPRGKVNYVPEVLSQDSSDVIQTQRAIFDLKTDGISFIYFDKAGVLFYWKDGKYERLITSD
jgi:hypothetical protein